MNLNNNHINLNNIFILAMYILKSYYIDMKNIKYKYSFKLAMNV